MGACQAKPKAKPKKKFTKPEGGYSWEKRANVDRSQYMVSKATGKTVVKAPGEVDGNQFVVEECTDCSIFVFDCCTNVTIDVCTRCTIFIGPCDSSVFARNCTDCTFLLVCQQFRARDLTGCAARLHCATEPVLEVSPDIRIACLDVSYDALPAQMARVGLSRWDNRWSECHNFTPEHRWRAEPLGGVAGGAGSRDASLEPFKRVTAKLLSAADVSSSGGGGGGGDDGGGGSDGGSAETTTVAAAPTATVDLSAETIADDADETAPPPPPPPPSQEQEEQQEREQRRANFVDDLGLSADARTLAAPPTIGVTSRGALGADAGHRANAGRCAFAFVVCDGSRASGDLEPWERSLVVLAAQESAAMPPGGGCWLVQSRTAYLDDAQAAQLLARLPVDDGDDDGGGGGGGGGGGSAKATAAWFRRCLKETPGARVVGMEWRGNPFGHNHNHNDDELGGSSSSSSSSSSCCLPELQSTLEEACGRASDSAAGPNAWCCLDGPSNAKFFLATFFDSWREQI